MNSSAPDVEQMRTIARVLSLHFEEGLQQSQIAAKLGLSTAKVNRLIKQGRELGMVQITIKSPFVPLFDLERELSSRWPLKHCVVVPEVTGSAEATLNQVGKGAGTLLLEVLQDGDTVAISAGKALSALIENLAVDRSFAVNIVPMTGGVQGQHYTDVNHIATELADRLGGHATLLHAPLHTASKQERDLLMSVQSVKSVMDQVANAAVALVGVGSVVGSNATYYEAHPVSEQERQRLYDDGIRGEFLGYLIDRQGKLSGNGYNSKLVAYAPDLAAEIPVTIGVASGPEKVEPIIAALEGGYLNSLVTDERTARSVLEMEIEDA
ncbi:sugar-binding transcriptional regulator [Hoeflea poritis]|uniref:Sugar-binding transcriptional regulator n=1 Tax=Hoeflea poritis TaxID=2993659 RepID=A0ABT4VPK0_9HYPH|nr:sugar-binding transcriptional regulator [Hoeflea poritis]MDA4846636.1 sugar-binding transcriptional regulator [Hoeflea poritis]